jgi:hypothetical protein
VRRRRRLLRVGRRWGPRAWARPWVRSRCCTSTSASLKDCAAVERSNFSLPCEFNHHLIYELLSIPCLKTPIKIYIAFLLFQRHQGPERADGDVGRMPGPHKAKEVKEISLSSPEFLFHIHCPLASCATAGRELARRLLHHQHQRLRHHQPPYQ